ncbi:MAG: hypothetical protein U0X20_12380 [Caldilineaceae bacterium]
MTHNLLSTALDAAINLPIEANYGRSPRVEALLALAPHLNDDQRTIALQAALDTALNLQVEANYGRSPRAEALVALAPHLDDDQRTIALQAALDATNYIGDITESLRSQLMLAPHLNDDQRTIALQAALDTAPSTCRWRAGVGVHG